MAYPRESRPAAFASLWGFGPSDLAEVNNLADGVRDADISMTLAERGDARDSHAARGRGREQPQHKVPEHIRHWKDDNAERRALIARQFEPQIPYGMDTSKAAVRHRLANRLEGYIERGRELRAIDSRVPPKVRGTDGYKYDAQSLRAHLENAYDQSVDSDLADRVIGQQGIDSDVEAGGGSYADGDARDGFDSGGDYGGSER